MIFFPELYTRELGYISRFGVFDMLRGPKIVMLIVSLEHYLNYVLGTSVTTVFHSGLMFTRKWKGDFTVSLVPLK